MSPEVRSQRPAGSDDPGQRRAWGWVRHLLDGGVTPWSSWQAEAEPVGRVVPGAQQLELLRRLNEAVGLDRLDRRLERVPEALATRVLEASAPGRGRPDLELVGAAHDSRFGAQPVDPSELDEQELLRVATYLLGEDLVALGPVPRRPDGLPRPWRRRYRLVGDPLLSDPVRRALTARGRPPRPGGEVVLLGADLPRMLADTWTANAFDSGVGSWSSWLETWRQRDQVPPRVDLPRIARTWTERRGADHVHLLMEGTGEWDRLPRLVGVRRLEVPPRPGAAAAELARGIAAVLGMMVNPPRRAELMRDGLLPRLPADAFAGVSTGSTNGCGPGLPSLPDEHREWVERRARRMGRRLARAGYAVDLVPAQVQGPTHSTAEQGVLSLAVRMLLGGWKERV